MIRILVVEDSATARSLLVQVLSTDPEIEVVGEAQDGVEGVEMTIRLRPDLVTMDIHMPRMDGLAATKEIMISAPTPIVLITGSTHAREVQTSMDSLRNGALDVLVKPPGPGSPGFEAAVRNLLATVKAMSQVKVVRHWRSAQAARVEAPSPSPTARHGRGKVVAIATSTGGPAALQAVLSDLPGTFPVPILVVQHITTGFTTGLATWLATVCPLRVKVAADGETASPHTVYLAPDDRHLGVSTGGRLVLSNAPPVGGFRPSGTPLFESVARAFGGATVAVILTGMGEDGVEGLRAVRRAGGQIIAQDEKTSVVFGMPGVAIASGLADVVLPLNAIASRLLTLV